MPFVFRRAFRTGLLFFSVLLVLPLRAWAQEPAFNLAAFVGIANPTYGPPSVNDIVVDAAGNSYVTGAFRGTMRFGNTTLAGNRTSNGVYDEALFVAKLDAAGSCRWAVESHGGGEGGNGIALDGSGNVYVTGYFRAATVTMGNITLANSSPGATLVPTYEVLVAKLDGNGNWLWARKAGGIGPDAGRALAVDAGGNAYVTGDYSSVASFGSTVLPNATAAAAFPNSSDVFIAKLDPQGNWQWVLRGGSGGGCLGSGIALDGRGHLYVAGYGHAAPTQVGPFSLGSRGGFTAKLTVAGGWQWVTPCSGTLGLQFIGVQESISPKVAVDAAGNACIAGTFLGQATFGPYTLNSTGRYYEAYVARLDASGAYQWAARAGGGDYTSVNDVALDARGNCLVIGHFSEPFNSPATGQPGRFGPFATTSSAGGFVALLDAAGTWQWVAQPRSSTGIGSGFGGIARCLALGPGLTTYIGGYSPQFGNPSLTYTIDFGSGVSLSDNHGVGYIARLAPYSTLTLAGDSVLCGGGQVQLTAQTTGVVLGYRWSTGATTASIAVTQAGTYAVVVTYAGGYTLTQQHRVRAVPTPAVQIAGPRTLCPGGGAALLATAPGGPRLRWSTGDTTAILAVTQPGTYTVTARYGAGCTVVAQAIVVANAVAISGRRQLCPGQSATLTAATTGAAVLSYRWSTGATTPTLVVAQAGTYAVTATFADGCQLTATHPVGPPQAQVASVSGDTVLCPGTRLQLTALNPDALTYQWSTGATTPTIGLDQPGLYAVRLTYAGGCTSRDSMRVDAAGPPPAFTLGADTTLCVEQGLVLRAPAGGGPGGRRWSDGSTGPTLVVREAGEYALELSTPCGTRTVSRRVAYQSCLFVPNVITPNGDGQNDWFVINELTRGPWHLEIYNRWGRQVYATPDYRNTWGAEAAPGLYFYLLRPAANAPVRKGWLEVIR